MTISTDWEDDYRDGLLFRFWIRAASFPDGFPGDCASAIQNCLTASDYRKALTELALKKGVNLP